MLLITGIIVIIVPKRESGLNKSQNLRSQPQKYHCKDTEKGIENLLSLGLH